MKSCSPELTTGAFLSLCFRDRAQSASDFCSDFFLATNDQHGPCCSVDWCCARLPSEVRERDGSSERTWKTKASNHTREAKASIWIRVDHNICGQEYASRSPSGLLDRVHDVCPFTDHEGVSFMICNKMVERLSLLSVSYSACTNGLCGRVKRRTTTACRFHTSYFALTDEGADRPWAPGGVRHVYLHSSIVVSALLGYCPLLQSSPDRITSTASA